VVIPVANPGRISGLRDLTREGLRIVLAAAEVPAGHYARMFLERASGDEAFRPDFGEMVLARVVSHEQNVRSVLMKVALGEADAGIVYESDAADAAEDVMRIPIPDPLNVYASYLIAPVSDSEHLRLARAFVSLVHSPRGQSILRRHGLVAATRT
jgi:molybdate transport system substrate-binding protein